MDASTSSANMKLYRTQPWDFMHQSYTLNGSVRDAQVTSAVHFRLPRLQKRRFAKHTTTYTDVRSVKRLLPFERGEVPSNGARRKSVGRYVFPKGLEEWATQCDVTAIETDPRGNPSLRVSRLFLPEEFKSDVYRNSVRLSNQGLVSKE